MCQISAMQSVPVRALTRFGLGAGPGDPLPGDPRSWASAQFDGPDADAIERRRLFTADEPHRGHVRPRSAAFYRADAQAAPDWAVATPDPFRQRLVWFWANHFTVSIRQGGTLDPAGPSVREAIRPDVTRGSTLPGPSAVLAIFQFEGCWDTHGNQVTLLRPPLAMLDAGLISLKGALVARFGPSRAALPRIFPASGNIAPMSGLFQTQA